MAQIPIAAKTRQAFTLVEMAIVLAILGVLLGGGSYAFRNHIQKEQRQRAETSVDAAAEALIRHAARRGSLPAGLGQIQGSARDSWNQPLAFARADELDTDDQLCRLSGTSLQLARNCTSLNASGECQGSYPTKTDIAFVVSSGGPDRSGSLRRTDSGDTRTLHLPAQGASFGSTSSFDDLVRWISLDELQQRADCRRTPVEILNRELPQANIDEDYRVEFYADGGEGSYEWCLDYSGLAAPAGLSSAVHVESDTCSAAHWSSASIAEISGTPTQINSWPVNVHVRDERQVTASASYVLTVNYAGDNPEGLNENADQTSDASFENFVQAEADNAEGDEDNVIVDTSDNSISLGTGNAGNQTGYGCLWYPSVYTINGNTSLRAYFEYEFEQNEADGFTFSFIDGGAPQDTCGGAGSGLGYAYHEDSNGEPGIPYITVVNEFDIFQGPSVYNDPNDRHVAIMTGRDTEKVPSEASNIHDAAHGNPDCDDQESVTSCDHAENGENGFFKTGKLYPVRIELEIYPDSDDTQLPAGMDTSECYGTCTGLAIARVWVGQDTSDFAANQCGRDNLDQSCTLVDTSDEAEEDLVYLERSLPISDNFLERGIKFGFTTGTGGLHQTVIIRNLKFERHLQ